MNIITITPNPALDAHLECEQLTLGGYHKARLLRRDPGGKGVNLSRALAVNSVDNVCFMLLGKDGSDEFILPLYNIGMRVECIYAEGRVRENLNIMHSGEETVIATDGFSVGEKELRELEDRLMPMLSPDTVLALCGSLPRGASAERMLALMHRVKATGARLVVDSRAFTLEELLSLRPYLIKPNAEEAELLCGRSPRDLADAARIAAAIRDCGAECVMLTMGGEGAALAAPDGEYVARAPQVSARSTVGAGDSSIAGFLAAIRAGEGYSAALARAMAYGAAAAMEEGSLPPSKKNVALLLPRVNVERLCDNVN